jgi:outer membrane PBP1 activator LpoA protein
LQQGEKSNPQGFHLKYSSTNKLEYECSSAGLRDGERIYPVQYSCKTANTNLELISNILQNTTHKICLLTAKKSSKG